MSNPGTLAASRPEGQSPLGLKEGLVVADEIRILIADDHPLMRGALRQSVAQSFAGAEIQEADQLQSAIDLLRQQSPHAPIDLLLLDLNMPGMNGFAGLLLLRAEFPSVPVVIVSASEDAETIGRAIDCGASGFVPKSAPVERIAEALNTVLDGEVWFPSGAPRSRSAEEAELAERVASLTPQQLRVLILITEGKLNKQIAWEIGVSEATVKAHVTMVLRKLHVFSRTQAVILAKQLKLAPGQDAAAG